MSFHKQKYEYSCSSPSLNPTSYVCQQEPSPWFNLVAAVDFDCLVADEA